METTIPSFHFLANNFPYNIWSPSTALVNEKLKLVILASAKR